MSSNLKELIERIEYLLNAKNGLNRQITEIFNTIKEEHKVDRPTISKIIKRRSQDPFEVEKEERQIKSLMMTLDE